MQVQTIPVTAFMQNARIITCEKTQQSAVIDPGGDAEKLLSYISNHNLTVTSIILTHGHLDHVGAAKILSESLKVDIIGPSIEDKFWFDALPMQAQMFGFNPVEPFYPTKWLTEQDTVKVGEIEFDVIQCPGHTPGHITLYNKTHDAVFVGDVLFRGSVGRTDFPKGNSEQLRDSINERLFILPDQTTVYSGHGENTSIGYEKLNNPFMSGRFG